MQTRVTDSLTGIWGTVCDIGPFDAGGAAVLHCSNTYFAGSSSVMTRFTLIGTYEILNDPR
jgi:hypothetical protein